MELQILRSWFFGVAETLETGCWIIQAIGLVAVFVGLIRAGVNAVNDKHLERLKTSLLIASVGALAWLIATEIAAAVPGMPQLTLGSS